MTARQSALIILNRCFQSGAWSTQTINSQIKDLPENEKALANRLSLGVMQNFIYLDYLIDMYCKIKDLPLRNILRLGVYQLLYMDKIPARAAINESVELAKKNGFKSASGLVNAVLHKVDQNRNVKVEDLSVEFSHPAWFVDKMISRHGVAFTRELLAANNTEPVIQFHKGINDETYVQDNAAYESIRMLNPTSGMKILDVCAAPGGKSFTSAVFMDNKGEIISCDIHEKKLNLISEGSKRLGINIIKTACMDASVFHPEFSEQFDAVIADVPCSGLGVIRKKPDIRFKTEREISSLPALQKKILDNVIKYVRPGGRLLYSTCTILEEENENITSGYNVISQKTFYPNVDDTDGFYAAVIQK